ncbi:MAG: N-acetylmuramoyl-L-alanine amidase [Hydrogenoanaerobacterium sp.]
MLRKRKHKRKLFTIILVLVFAVITLAAGLLASLKLDGLQLFAPKSEASVEEPVESASESSSLESSEDESESEAPPVSVEAFKIPDELRGVFLVPGSDFMAGKMDEETLKAEVDKALSDAIGFTANAIIVQTKYDGKNIYSTAAEEAYEGLSGFDVLGYISAKAAEKNLLTYATFDVLKDEAMPDTAALDKTAARARAFAKRYNFAGIYLENFYVKNSDGGFVQYQKNGSGMGYQNFARQMATAAFKTASNAIRDVAPQTQVGLFTDPVWANKKSDEKGSETSASFEALNDGNADTKAWVEGGLVDFIAVKATGYTSDPALKFKNVISWWGELANANGKKLYPVHSASKVAPKKDGGWDGEELAQQYLEAKEIKGYGGSVYDSLAVLVKNEDDSTVRLKKAFKSEIDLSYILEKLEFTQPTQEKVTTTEATYTIIGASDPEFPVLMDGKEIQRNASGYINFTIDLKEGDNVFVFEHKEQKLTYTINRKTEVLKSITPNEDTTLEGGMTLTITAMAYPNAKLSAKLNGSTINMEKSAAEDDDDQIDKNDSYVRFVGTYKTKVVKTSTNIGCVVVTATAGDSTNTMQSGEITLTKPLVIGDGELVEVKAASAETFPNDTLNDISSNTYYPLGLGARDYTASNKLAYTNSKGTHYYYLLQSGVRVNADDISVIKSGNNLNGNKVSSVNIKNNSGLTYVTFKCKNPVSYSFAASGDKIVVDFNYTDSVPQSGKVEQNPMFSKISGSGSAVTLTLKNPASFIGYTAAYEGNDLVFKFKNSPGGISGARIFIDPGHSSDSVGAKGSYPNEHEYQINRAVAEQLAGILTENGATVKILNNSSFVELAERMRQAKEFDPHVLVSIHANAASNTSATGSEAYHFYGFSSGLSSRVSSGIAQGLETSNRGGKKGLFYMTRTSEFAATLSESGFLSNTDEYDKLLSSSYQAEIARGIANGINAYLAAAAGSSGVEITTDTTEKIVTNEEESIASDIEVSNADDDTTPVKVRINAANLSMTTGETDVLEAVITPDSAAKKGVKWASTDRYVVRVDNEGNITALSAGTAVITATSYKDDTKVGRCNITVTGDTVEETSDESTEKSKIKSIEMDTPELEIEVGGEAWLTAITDPENNKEKLVWKSKNTDIAKVAQDGTVKGIKAGTTTIIVTAQNGKNATCKVTVIK